VSALLRSLGVDLVAHVAQALALGWGIAQLMRRFHLHWTWSLVLLGVIVVLPGLFGSWALVLALASLCAALSGRSAHDADLRTGGDLGRIAAERYSPLDAVAALWRMVSLKLRARQAAAAQAPNVQAPAGPAAVTGSPSRDPQASFWHRNGRLAVGRTRTGKVLGIPFADSTGGRHALVVGATGKGKTVTETWIATRAVEAGLGAIVIDPKGDPRMREQLRLAAQAAGRPFVEWTPSGPTVYNPFASGSPTSIADRALAGERFTEPHYLRQAQRYLGYAAGALRAAGQTISLRTLVEHLDPPRLESLARTLPDEQARTTYEYLDALTARQREGLTGVRDRLAIIADSDVGPWLDPSTCGAPAFDLLGAVRKRAVAFFSLHADQWPLLAQMLGAAIVQDLLAALSALQERPIPTVVVCDELSSLGAERLADVCAKARGAGFNVVLGTQELSDLRLPGRERLLEQVLGTLSCLIAHCQVVPESIDLLVRLGGTRGAWSGSRRSDGRWTSTRTSETVLDPEQLRSLPAGAAAVIELGEHAGAHFAQMFSSPEQALGRSMTTIGRP
jgi:helicase HerA-like protein/type IV secretory system conjugative DNA transfer VirD4/TraG family protein